MPALPDRVRIVEVGPRDGLQNEPAAVPTAAKLEFIRALADAGLSQIEATSFVHPQRVPQLADAAEVIAGLPRRAGVTYSALVPNAKGLQRALDSGIERIAVFTAASETFTQKNIGMSIAESLETFAPVVRGAIAAGRTVRGYVSTCFECPYEGAVSADRAADVAAAMLDLGCDEVALSDTLGVAAPAEVADRLVTWLRRLPREKVALHFHDTCGTALANVHAGLLAGITTFDASAGGLGGCPFAPGAAGNLATEDLVYMLDRMQIATGVNAAAVVSAARTLAESIGRPLTSRQSNRLAGACGVKPG